MTAEIIAVGTEILLGDILNTNSHYLSLELARLGVSVKHHTTVGDNWDRLEEAVNTALTRCDVVITSGGLGPTPDDITKEVCAKCLGKKLVTDEKALADITDYYNRSGRPMPENNVKQALVPEGATVFYNDNGTAPGCAITKGEKTVIILPGPPRELKPMFQKYCLPLLSTGKTLVSHNVHVIGKGESAVALELKDLFESENPTVAPYAKSGECRIRITAFAGTESEADALCTPVVEEVCRRLGSAVYGVDCGSVEQAVVNLLLEQGKTVACAESCTGGLVAKRITDISGSSAVFGFGAVTYANEAKVKMIGVSEDTLKAHGAVSEQTACEMARGVRKLAGASIGVATTGVAGPEGSELKPVGLCYVGLSTPEKTFAVKVLTGQNGSDCRAVNRLSFSTRALDLVRRELEGYSE